MKVGFRVDAGVEMGGGHLVRCMCLAAELHSSGVVECIFIMREHHAGFIESVRQAGFDVVVLPLEFQPDYSCGDYVQWLGGSLNRELEMLLSEFERRGFSNSDWLVVDHYGLDSGYELEVKKSGVKVAVIDDLVNRQHQCDLLIDQTCGRLIDEYKSLVNKSARLCVGHQYCLLRPEFRQWRKVALARRESFIAINQILVNFGSTDPSNITSEVLAHIKDWCIAENIILNVVLGSASPYIQDVEKVVSTIPQAVLHVDARNMAELMTYADIAIGAAGSATWERCSLGLPTLLVKTAENQSDVIDRMSSLGGTVFHDLLSKNQPELFLSEFAMLTRNYQAISVQAASLVDGRGVERVKNILIGGDGC